MITIEPSPHRPGFYRVIAGRGLPQRVVKYFRDIVGSKVVSGIWLVPMDALKIREVKDTLEEPIHWTKIDRPSCPKIETSGLYTYQKHAAARACTVKRLLLNFEPGLGKTATAIAACKAANAQSVLVVCPAIVRDTWKQELAQWWPDSPESVVIETGKQATNAAGHIVIVSYELLPKIPRHDWDAVIIDESHYVKNPKSTRAKTVRKLLSGQPQNQLRLFLTGTPFDNEPLDGHNQIDLLWPGLWGSQWEFKNWYCKERINTYAYSGKEFYSIKESRAEELRRRFERLSERITVNEVADILPDVPILQPIYVKPTKSFDLRAYLDAFDRRDIHNIPAGDAIKASGETKKEYAFQLVKNDLDGGATHVSVMTHFRDTAKEIATDLQRLGVPIACITGADSHKTRHQEIQRLADEPEAIFVGTMHSISVGINELKAFSHVIYAEFDYRPGEIVQSMKRYHRIGGVRPIIRVIILEGTLEERAVISVSRKLRDQKRINVAGTLATQLKDSIDDRLNDDQLFEAFREAATKMRQGDVYG